MSAFGLSNDKDRQIELARLYETLALSRDLIARSRMLIGELENVRVQSWKAIEESHILLDKAKRITKSGSSEPSTYYRNRPPTFTRLSI